MDVERHADGGRRGRGPAFNLDPVSGSALLRTTGGAREASSPREDLAEETSAIQRDRTANLSPKFVGSFRQCYGRADCHSAAACPGRHCRNLVGAVNAHDRYLAPDTTEERRMMPAICAGI